MYWSEQAGNPILARQGADQALTATQSGGNQVGKEVRFGIADSALWATITTDTSTGAVNNAHDSLTPLAGGMAMLNIALGEVVFGGVGVGLMGLLVNAILAVFIAGLMVGRTPEYLGKKIEAREMKLAVLAVLYFSVAALGPRRPRRRGARGQRGDPQQRAARALRDAVRRPLADRQQRQRLCRDHGERDVLGDTRRPRHAVGPLLLHHPVPGPGGSLAAKKRIPESSGTFPTTGGTFVVLLVGVILIVGALTYLPALALGPVVEQLLMNAGKVF